MTRVQGLCHCHHVVSMGGAAPRQDLPQTLGAPPCGQIHAPGLLLWPPSSTLLHCRAWRKDLVTSATRVLHPVRVSQNNNIYRGWIGYASTRARVFTDSPTAIGTGHCSCHFKIITGSLPKLPSRKMVQVRCYTSTVDRWHWHGQSTSVFTCSFVLLNSSVTG